VAREYAFNPPKIRFAGLTNRGLYRFVRIAPGIYNNYSLLPPRSEKKTVPYWAKLDRSLSSSTTRFGCPGVEIATNPPHDRWTRHFHPEPHPSPAMTLLCRQHRRRILPRCAAPRPPPQRPLFPRLDSSTHAPPSSFSGDSSNARLRLSEVKQVATRVHIRFRTTHPACKIGACRYKSAAYILLDRMSAPRIWYRSAMQGMAIVMCGFLFCVPVVTNI
jgi:hypothetical protein